MLGLIDTEFWTLKLDYSLSINDVFITTARHIISKSQSLNIFGGYQNPTRIHGLPSWTPNLIDIWKYRTFPKRGSSYKFGDVPADEEPDFIFEGESNGVLRAKGCRVDIIEKVGDDTPKQNSSVKEPDDLSTRWRAFVKPISTEPNWYSFDLKYADENGSNYGAWVRLLCGGSDFGQPRPVTAAPLKTQGNYQMIKSLLLPDYGDVRPVNASEMRGRVHEQLRKYGVRRRLGLTQLGKTMELF